MLLGNKKPVIIINSWDSECGFCGQPADPHEKTHKTIKRYSGETEEGCGIEYKYVTTGYSDIGEKVKEMRPDLEYIDFLELCSFAAENLTKENEQKERYLKIKGAEEFFQLIDKKYKNFKVSEAMGDILKEYKKSLQK